MGSLSGIFGSATRSLLTYGDALSVIQDNIANAATPGHARRRPVISPIVAPDGRQSFGVEVSAVQSLRDRLLDFQVFQAKQSKAFFDQRVDILQQTELQFPLTGGGSLGASIDGLFDAFSELTVAPTDLSLRRAVLSSANGLAASFRSRVREVERQRFDLDVEARSTVTRINTLLQRVAELGKVREAPDARRPNSSRETRLNQALDELSALIDFSLLEQSDGTLAVIGGDGVPLVVGAQFRSLSVIIGQQGIAIFDQDGTDVTAQLQTERGSLSAVIEARNRTLPSFLSDVNRLAKEIAEQVNEQLARGVDLTGAAGQPLFAFNASSVIGAGRVPGVTGAATPLPPDSITIDFTGGATASITANLDSFFVAAAPPAIPATGETISVTFTSADGTISRTITTAPLLGGENTAALATRLNDQIALDAQLRGLIAFSDAGNGNLKVVLSEQARQPFDFTAATSNPAFTTGLEAGGTIGGESAEEIAAALNAVLAAQAALDPALAAAGIRFSALGGEVKIDGDAAFNFTVTETPGATVDGGGAPTVTGFVSGLPANGAAGGAQAAATLTVSGITPTELAAGTSAVRDGNETSLAIAALADAPLLSGVTFTDFYSLLVNRIGDETQNSATRAETQDQVLIAAQNLRDGLSGVDLNEEAVRLIEFEKAFQAVLRVMQVTDELITDILRLVR